MKVAVYSDSAKAKAINSGIMFIPPLKLKIVLTELIAYLNLSDMQVGVNGLSEKTAVIASYALCGFSNFASIGIQLGGIGSIAPDRKKDISKLVTKAMIGGAIASWITACIAGLLI